jgi:hypothetical protein
VVGEIERVESITVRSLIPSAVLEKGILYERFRPLPGSTVNVNKIIRQII